MEKNNPTGENPVTFISQSTEDMHEMFSVLELFPVPIEVFSPDGLSLFVNQAFINFFHIGAEDIVGRLNILNDPYINIKLGLSDYIRRVFAGEILSLHDINVPFEEFGSCGSNQIKRPESDLYQDITSFPLRSEDNSIIYVVTVFMTKRVCRMRMDIMKAKQFIDEHWSDDFDLERIARIAGISRHHLARLFKKMVGVTPYGYYQEIKIEKIKDALADISLSISQAFSACGADYSSGIKETFKSRVGMTPTQYRKILLLELDNSRQKASSGEIENRTAESPAAPPVNPLCTMKRRIFQVAELFPIPIQIFEPSGDIIFINEATLKMWNVRDTSLILGKYNLRSDPLVNDQFGLRDEIRRTFQGEMVLIQDIRVPLETFWEWYKTRSNVYDIEMIYTDILNFSVFDADGGLAFVVGVFFTSRVYGGRSEVAKVREYLENHWREKFDAAGLAKLVCLSSSQLFRLFKKHTGMTPYHYYQEIKINKLKTALRDNNKSIAEAFISCGFDYPGNSTRFFKEKTGMTPSGYRKQSKSR
jgi:transcriptional regulator GlxA family with amidase domain